MGPICKWKWACALEGSDHFFWEDHLVLMWQKNDPTCKWVDPVRRRYPNKASDIAFTHRTCPF